MRLGGESREHQRGNLRAPHTAADSAGVSSPAYRSSVVTWWCFNPKAENLAIAPLKCGEVPYVTQVFDGPEYLGDLDDPLRRLQQHVLEVLPERLDGLAASDGWIPFTSGWLAMNCASLSAPEGISIST